MGIENQNLRGDCNHWQQQYQALNQGLAASEATHQQLEQNLQWPERQRNHLPLVLNQPPA